jgi:hypothetical protein
MEDLIAILSKSIWRSAQEDSTGRRPSIHWNGCCLRTQNFLNFSPNPHPSEEQDYFHTRIIKIIPAADVPLRLDRPMLDLCRRHQQDPTSRNPT